MGITAEEGPSGTFGRAVSPPNSSNPSAGPSFWYQGDMLLDPRAPFTYQPGQRDDAPTFGWPTSGSIPVIDQVPSTASASNIVSAATPVAGTPLTLVTSSGSGVTVGCSITNANTGQIVTGLLGLDVGAARTVTGVFTNGSPKITWSGVVPLGVQVGDTLTLTTSGTLPTPFALLTTYYVVVIGNGAMMISATPGGLPLSATTAGSGTQTLNLVASSTQAPVVYGTGSAGTGGPLRQWNPSWALSRALVITTNGNDSTGSYTIAGYDIYGYPMTQTMTGPNATTGNTLKAFKYIASVTPAGTIASTSVSVGTIDLFGLPLRTDWPVYLTMYWNSAAIVAGTTASTTFAAADINTATALTGDVRGTVYGGSASDGTKRLVVFCSPQAANLNSTVGLLGQAQF